MKRLFLVVWLIPLVACSSIPSENVNRSAMDKTQTANPATTLALPSTPTTIFFLPNHESFLLSNNFIYSESFTQKCLGSCNAYYNEKYAMRVELYDNRDITIMFSEIEEALTESQGTLMLNLVDEFYGRTATVWVIENINKSIDHEQTTDTNGYRLFMRVSSRPIFFSIIATPLH